MTINMTDSTIQPMQDVIRNLETSNKGHKSEINSAQKPSWWMKMTQMEKSLCALVALTVFICLALISVIVLFTCSSSSRYGAFFMPNGLTKPWTINANHHHATYAPPLANKKSSSPQHNQTISAPAHHISNHTTHSTGSGLIADSSEESHLLESIGDDESSSDHEPSPLLVPSSKHDEVCMTPACITSSAQILTNLDLNADPCDDFYQFACGGWIDNQLIPDEKTAVSVFSMNQDDLNIKLRALVEKDTTQQDPPIVTQMRNIYKSCLNLTQIELRGSEPLLNALKEFGGWPVLDTLATSGNMDQPMELGARARRRSARTGMELGNGENNNKFDWIDTLIKFRQRGFSHDILIDLSVVPDVRNNTRFIIDLDQSSLGLPDRSYFLRGLNDSTVAAYYNLMVESAIMLGADRGVAKSQLMEVLNFETNLAKMSMPREQRRNVTRLYNKMKVSELYTLAPHINWEKYLDNLLGDHISLNEDVIVKVPQFLTSLDELLQKTSSRLLANYMIWRVVRQSMPLMSKRWRELAQSYSTVTTGRQREEPRWEQCMGALSGTLNTALSAMYVKNHFKQESKTVAIEMVAYIRKEFLKILGEVDWMDEETRTEAKKKAQAITSYIGYPDELLDDNLIEELYSGLRLIIDNYYENVRNLRKWSTNYAFGLLRKPNKKGDWRKHARAAIVNAFYNSLENSIEFPAGILQGAFFNAKRPNYLNYGAIGFIIGHEITHGFDDRGRQFDMEGNNRNWWKPKTDERFKERAQCIIDQYSNYTVSDTSLKVNGLNTQGENIADNGGIKEAFRAYNQWVKDHGQEGRLPGLNLSPRQLFWVSAANIWCGKFRPEVLRIRVNAGAHSPAKYRIIGPLSNSREFSDTFKCPLGSPMNPKKKCSVW